MLYSLVVYLNNGIERVTVYETTSSKGIEDAHGSVSRLSSLIQSNTVKPLK